MFTARGSSSRCTWSWPPTSPPVSPSPGSTPGDTARPQRRLSPRRVDNRHRPGRGLRAAATDQRRYQRALGGRQPAAQAGRTGGAVPDRGRLEHGGCRMSRRGRRATPSAFRVSSASSPTTIRTRSCAAGRVAARRPARPAHRPPRLSGHGRHRLRRGGSGCLVLARLAQPTEAAPGRCVSGSLAAAGLVFAAPLGFVAIEAGGW